MPDSLNLKESIYLSELKKVYLDEAVTLDKFHKDYFDKLPSDKKEIFYNPQRGHYHILMFNKQRAGIAGVILNPKHKQYGFFGIYIEKRYRGKDLLKKAAELIYKKYKLKSLIATIKNYNKASIKGHLKAGFIPIEDIVNPNAIEKNYNKNEIVLIYRG